MKSQFYFKSFYFVLENAPEEGPEGEAGVMVGVGGISISSGIELKSLKKMYT